MEKLALAIDIGGTNCVYGLVNNKGEVMYENSVKTNSFNQTSQFIQYLKKDSFLLTKISSIVGIGIGAPNGNHFSGEIQFAPNLPWEKGIIPIKKYFEEEFRLPTQLTNDANAAAEGEKLFGVAKSMKNFVVITLGTGLGSGIYINNNIVYGAHGLAGEFGHIRIIPNGRNCKCGRKGCLETYASSTGIIRSFNENINEFKSTSSLSKIKNLTSKDIFKHAENGDAFSIYLVNYTAEILGSALADFASFSDPEAFILFGGIAQSGEYFRNRVEKNFKKNLLNIYKNKTQILTSTLHSKNAAILGNAASVFKTLDL
jgi:glucokinase